MRLMKLACIQLRAILDISLSFGTFCARNGKGLSKIKHKSTLVVSKLPILPETLINS